MKKSLIRRIVNRVLGKMAQGMPGSTTLRPLLHQLRGVCISGTVFIGDDVYIENEYPECVIIEDGVQIGLRSTIIAHTRGAGKVLIRRNAFIGASALIIAPVGSSLTIGEGAVVGAGSVITSDVPPGTLVAPERARPCALVTVPFTVETSYRDFRLGLRPFQSQPPHTAASSNRHPAKRSI